MASSCSVTKRYHSHGFIFNNTMKTGKEKFSSTQVFGKNKNKIQLNPIEIDVPKVEFADLGEENPMFQHQISQSIHSPLMTQTPRKQHIINIKSFPKELSFASKDTTRLTSPRLEKLKKREQRYNIIGLGNLLLSAAFLGFSGRDKYLTAGQLIGMLLLVPVSLIILILSISNKTKIYREQRRLKKSKQ